MASATPESNPVNLMESGNLFLGSILTFIFFLIAIIFYFALLMYLSDEGKLTSLIFIFMTSNKNKFSCQIYTMLYVKYILKTTIVTLTKLANYMPNPNKTY